MNRVALGVLVVLGVLTAGACKGPTAPSTTPPPPADPTRPASILLDFTTGIRTASVRAYVRNDALAMLPDVAVTFSTNLGTITPDNATTNEKGIATTTVTGEPGSAKVTASIGTLTTTTLVVLQAPPPPLPPNIPPPPPPTPPLAVGLSASGTTLGSLTSFAANVSNARPPVSYVWQFGDGPTHTTAVPSDSHTYPAAATYQTSVTITDAGGATASAAQAVIISVAPPLPLNVSLTCTAHILTIPTACQATVTDNGIDVTALMTGFVWTFGDGLPAPAITASATHTYTAPGTYTVTVRANGPGGRTGTATASATVPSSLVGVLTVNCSTGIRLSVPPALSTCVVAATVGGTVMPSLSIGPVDWDWGDHTTTLAAPPNTATHTYGSANTFTVVATATIAGTTGPATGSTTTTIAP